MRWIMATSISAAFLVAPILHAAPANPDCGLPSLSSAERDWVQSGKIADAPSEDEKAAVAKFDKLLANCAKANGWTTSERNRIEQLNLWTFVAETQQPALAKYGIWPATVRDAVDDMSQLILGERSWVLKKDQLFLAIEPGLKLQGVNTDLIRASAPAKQAVVDIAASYASARQERIKLGLETKLPGLKVAPVAPPVIAKVEPKPAPAPTPSPAPVAVTPQPAKPAPVPPTPPKEPIKLVEIDYSPLLQGKIYPAEPWSCALYAMPGKDREGWDASYDTPKRALMEKARDAAVASCAAKHGWNAALQAEVRDYTEKWIIVGDLERFLLEEDIIYSERSEAIRKLADADLASAATLSHSPAFQKTINDSIALYSVSFFDREATSKEIESIIRSHKLWAQIELFHRKKGVKQK